MLDADANGYVRGESCHAVLVAKAESAVHGASRVVALLLGSAVNQDGRSSSLTAPNGPAQQAVIRSALGIAAVAPSALHQLSLHGTGTALGDPIEVNAAASAMLHRDARRAFSLSLLASKSWHGHAEPDAGLVALDHALLGSRATARPALLHVRRLNPHIIGVLAMLPRGDGTGVAVARQPAPLPRLGNSAELVMSGVSSFAFAGAIFDVAPP